MIPTIVSHGAYWIMFSDLSTLIALYGLLVSIPFYMLAIILLFVGRMRTERIPTNIFHRAFEFCESTIVGRIIGGVALFSPTIFTIVGTMIFDSSEILDGVIFGTLPWLLISLFFLGEFKYHRKI